MKERFVSLTELAELLGMSGTRLYKLIAQGSFPEPLRNPANNRPYYNLEMITEAQEVLRTKVGKNGLPVTVNRKAGQAKKRPTKASGNKHEDLVAALASLGVQATAAQVDAALKLVPRSLAEPELIKALFLELRKKA